MSTLESGSLFSVKGLVAVITGGGSGIGLMVARALDANGARAVYIIGRRKETLERGASQCPNGSIIPVVGDVTSKDSLASIAERVRAEQGHINVLLANSGINGIPIAGKLPTDRRPTIKEFKDAFWSSPMEEFTQTLHVNCTAAFYTTLAFLELLDAGNKADAVAGQTSQVIVTSSIAAFTRRTGTSGFDYGSSKAAVVALVKSLATFLGPYHIRVNTIAPGLYPSEMIDDEPFMKGLDKKPWEVGALSSDMAPLERTGAEEDMAGAALYMMSRAGGYLTGTVLITDGGRLGQTPATY